MTRRYHQINVSGANVAENETPVTVYSSPEFESLYQAHASADGNTKVWDANIMNSSHRSKFFSLMPFFWEANWSNK